MVEILQMIFDSAGNYPSFDELVLCDLFRNIDLREMRGIFVPVSFYLINFASIFQTKFLCFYLKQIS